MSRRRGIVVGIALLAPLAFREGLVAQGQAPAPNAARSPARRVPSGYSQLGLSPEQKERIYAIRAARQARIAQLEQMLEHERATELIECQSVLTPSQLQMLARGGGLRTAPAPAPMPAEGPPTPPRRSNKPAPRGLPQP